MLGTICEVLWTFYKYLLLAELHFRMFFSKLKSELITSGSKSSTSVCFLWQMQKLFSLKKDQNFPPHFIILLILKVVTTSYFYRTDRQVEIICMCIEVRERAHGGNIQLIFIEQTSQYVWKRINGYKSEMSVIKKTH